MESRCNKLEAASKPAQLILVLHTVADYLHGQGAGIDVVQRAECAATGMVRNHLIPDEERRYGITRKGLAFEKLKSVGNAQMLALVRAFALAYGTIKRIRNCSDNVRLQKVTVYSDSQRVVQVINHHIRYAPDSLLDVASTKERSIIEKVITGVRKLSRRSLEFAIAVSCGKDKEGEKAKKMARQRGRKACASRRRARLAYDNSVKQEAVPGGHGTFELPIRGKEASEHVDGA